MAKAVLVLDKMPMDCEDCQLAYRNAYAGVTCPALVKPVGDTWISVANGKRSELCPLKELPERIDYTHNGKYLSNETQHFYEGRTIGWNECLDEIEGTEDD